jgi:hypothetical protein
MKVTSKHMKKAIVLLMTIGFIALISAMVLISLSISKKSFDEVVYLDARNQFSVVFKDFVTMLKKNSEKIDSQEKLDGLLSIVMPAMIEPKTGVEFGFDLESQMGKLNVNYLLNQISTDENDTELLERPFLNYFSHFELKEPRLLLDIMLDTIDKDDLERAAYSEIAAEDYDFTQGSIYSYRHLKKIFNRYYEVSKDANIYKIDQDLWEESFYFGDTNRSKQLLDCDQLDMVETINLITDNRYPNYSEMDFCKEFNSTVVKDDPDLRKLKDIYNISGFDKNKHYLIKCNIIFNNENFKRNVTFDYDLKTARIGNIDKHFQE